MRVIVNIPPSSHPELLNELKKISPRGRAERLRMLATFGLVQLSQPVISKEITSSTLAESERQSVQTEKEEATKQSLKAKLKEGLL